MSDVSLPPEENGPIEERRIKVKSLACCLGLSCFAVLGVVFTPSSAQDATKVAQTLPSDPRELMLLAAKANNLYEDDVQPWHLKATFTVLDESGNPIDHGSYEEFWGGGTKHKLTIAGVAYTRTHYATDKGLVGTGLQYLPSFQLDALGSQFSDPLPRLKAIPKSKFVRKVVVANGAKFACLGHVTPQVPFLDETYCLESSGPVLRSVYSPTLQTQYVHDGIIKFQDRYVAEDLRFLQAGKLVLTAHLDRIEPLIAIGNEDFTPPPDAVRKPNWIGVDEGALDTMLIKKVRPVYPDSAKLAHVKGPVVLLVRFGTDGLVASAWVIDGPQLLREAALDAVRRWVSKPFAINGEPVEANSIVHAFPR